MMELKADPALWLSELPVNDFRQPPEPNKRLNRERAKKT